MRSSVMVGVLARYYTFVQVCQGRVSLRECFLEQGFKTHLFRVFAEVSDQLIDIFVLYPRFFKALWRSSNMR